MNEHQRLLAQLPERPPSQRWKVGTFLLFVSVFYERLAYYGLISNLINFLMGYPNNWTSYNSNIATFYFEFVSSFFAVIGAWLADAVLGKFRVIIIGYLIYICFYLPFPFIYFQTWDGSEPTTIQPFCFSHHNKSIPNWKPNTRCHDDPVNKDIFHEVCSGTILASLFMVGLGSAFIRSVITPFGAETVSQHSNKTRSFFSWYYLSLNVGMIVAYLGLNYIQVNLSMFWGYMTGCICLCGSLSIFFFSSKLLVRSKPSGNITDEIYRVLVESISKLRCCCQGVEGTVLNDVSDVTTDSEDLDNRNGTSSKFPICMDKCKRSKGGFSADDMVENAKLFVRVLIVFIPIIFFWMCWYQNRTYFLSQALHMRLPKIFNQSVFEDVIDHYIPVTWLEMIDSYAIFLILPLLELIIYPWIEKKGFDFSIYRRMGLGMIFSIFAMIVAGIVERNRMISFWGSNNTSPYVPEGRINQTIVGTIYFAADMSFWWQIPQYILLGFGEVFTNVAGIELAFRVAPLRMQSLFTGFYWLFASIGSLLGILLTVSVEGRLIFSDHCYDINYRKPCPPPNNHQFCSETRLDIYFYILAGIQFFGFIILCIITRFIKIDSQTTSEERERNMISIKL